VLLFLHGVGGINNGKGCRNPGLTTQFPLLKPEYAAKVPHIVLVPVAQRPNWRHHFTSAMALVDMALSELGGDPSRVAIAGQSMGGHGAYLYAAEMAPGRFCAVVAMCAYADEAGPIADRVPAAIVEPLKATPIWIFHAEEDDRVPPPGRPQDDSTKVVRSFEAAGNTAMRHTRYRSGLTPPNYIAGHAAFEFAFADEDLWPWLAAQRLPLPAPTADAAAATAVTGFGLSALGLLGLLSRACCGLPRLARAVSTAALIASSAAMLGLMQAEGGLVDSCYGFSFFEVSVDDCRQIGAEVASVGEAHRGWLALAISKARAENCFALGMGVGALYALVFLAKGTPEVAAVHLMHAIWAISVCLANAQNAGLLPFPAEANIDTYTQGKLVPFVAITGVQACLGAGAFVLSSLGGRSGSGKDKTA